MRLYARRFIPQHGTACHVINREPGYGSHDLLGNHHNLTTAQSSRMHRNWTQTIKDAQTGQSERWIKRAKTKHMISVRIVWDTDSYKTFGVRYVVQLNIKSVQNHLCACRGGNWFVPTCALNLYGRNEETCDRMMVAHGLIDDA